MHLHAVSVRPHELDALRERAGGLVAGAERRGGGKDNHSACLVRACVSVVLAFECGAPVDVHAAIQSASEVVAAALRQAAQAEGEQLQVRQLLLQRRQRALAAHVERHSDAGVEGVGVLQRVQEHSSQKVQRGQAIAGGRQQARRLAAPHHLPGECSQRRQLRRSGRTAHAHQRDVHAEEAGGGG